MALSKTFRRVEDKYLISREQMENLLEMAGDRLHKDRYPTSNMHNLYFDTKDYDLIVRANDNEPFRKKIRARSYNEPQVNSDVFIEIKTKLKKNDRKISGKRRFMVKTEDFEKYLSDNTSFEAIITNKKLPDGTPSINSAKNIQIAREADYLINHFSLTPKMFITYNRESYAGAAAHDEHSHDKDAFRITFDKNLRYRTDNLGLFITNTETDYFKNDEKNIIMEVKTLGSMPLWFVQILSEFKILPQPFSKYGRIYQQIKEANNV